MFSILVLSATMFTILGSFCDNVYYSGPQNECSTLPALRSARRATRLNLAYGSVGRRAHVDEGAIYYTAKRSPGQSVLAAWCTEMETIKERLTGRLNERTVELVNSTVQRTEYAMACDDELTISVHILQQESDELTISVHILQQESDELTISVRILQKESDELTTSVRIL